MKKTDKSSFSIIKLLFFIFINCFLIRAQQVTYSFSSAGVVGQNGPTQAQINTAYLNTNLNGSVTVLSGSLAGIQQFTIPVTAPYRIIAAGSSSGPGAPVVNIICRYSINNPSRSERYNSFNIYWRRRG